MTTFYAICAITTGAVALIASTSYVMYRSHARTIYWSSSILTIVFGWLTAPQRSILGPVLLCGFAAVFVAWWWTPFLTRRHPTGFNDVFGAWLTRALYREQKDAPPVNRYDKLHYKDTDRQARDTDSDGNQVNT